MTVSLLYSLTGFLVFLTGICGLVFHSSMLRRTLALNVTGAGVFLVVVAQAYTGENAIADPVPHGLVLTGIVIAASATALILYLIEQLRLASAAAESERQEE